MTYADLYRRTKIEETVYELLTQQYELAKVQEAKEIPSVKVLDSAVVPTVKSSPHRVVLTLCGTALVLCGTVAWILLRKKWTEIDPSDPGRLLAEEMAAAVVVKHAPIYGSWFGGARLGSKEWARGGPQRRKQRVTPRALHKLRREANCGGYGDLQQGMGFLSMNGTAARQASSASASAANFAATPTVSGKSLGGEEFGVRGASGRVRIGLLRQTIYVAIDVTMVILGVALVFWLNLDFWRERGFSISLTARDLPHAWAPGYVGFLLLYVALIVLACKSQDLYRTPKEVLAIEESVTVLRAVGMATALFVLFVFASGNKEISRLTVACAGALNVFALAGWRYAKRRYVLRRAVRGECTSRVLIVGAGPAGRALATWLEANRHLGYFVCGFVDSHVNGDARVLGSYGDFRRVALEKFVDQVFVALPADREVVKEIFLEARRLRLDLNIVPDLYDGLGWHAPLHTIGGFPVLELHGQPIPAFGLAAKRVLDVLLGSWPGSF